MPEQTVQTDEGWLETVAENREALEEWANSDLPLADEVEQMLREADQHLDGGNR